jgi:N-acetylglucosaminyldiphosphoundecaprenol N-acetyl-beta-D-mannosaminyltransferase
MESSAAVPLILPPPVAILGVPFDVVTTAQTVELIAWMIASGRPHYLATANVDFVVQAMEDVELRRILFDAHLVLADGMPLVWASRRLGNPLPERVTGSDMVPRLLRESESRGWRVFFLGGTPESVAQAAENTRAKHPRLQLVGAYSPPFRPLLEMDHDDIKQRVQAARPDLLFVAFGCPKQEKWINMHYRDLGVPVSVGVGATIDFLAGTVKRAPVWMQQTGMEWAFRLAQEPKRLAGRYGRGFRVFGRALLAQLAEMRERRRGPASLTPPPTDPAAAADGPRPVPAPERLDAAAAAAVAGAWMAVLETGPLLLDLRSTRLVDSTGIGLLIRLQKRARTTGQALVLVGLRPEVESSLRLMKLEGFFTRAADPESAARLARGAGAPPVATLAVTADRGEAVLCWQGEVTADTVAAVNAQTEPVLAGVAPGGAVRIDLAAVTFVDSSGVGLMVRLKKQAWQRNVSVVFADPPAAVLNVLELLRLSAYLLRPPS